MPVVSPIRFGVYELHRETGELFNGGTRIRLQQQPLKVLYALLDRGGELVTRDELKQQLAPDSVFGDLDHALNVAVAKLRTALNDSADKPLYIETFHKRGYRFVAPVVRETSTAPSVTSVQAPAEMAPPSRSSRRALVMLATLAVILAGVAFVRYRIASASAEKIQSIAVLPLANLSGDSSQDYFADGMTEELITMLARNTSLRVISHTSVTQYKGAGRPLKDIGRELAADAIVEGSVSRTSTGVHLNVQLINAQRDAHIWADSFDRDLDGSYKLPAELANIIAKKLGTPSQAAAGISRYINPEAHDAYLRGRYFWYAADYGRAQEYMEKAVRLQPDYAAAWSGLADAYAILAVAGRVPASQVRSQVEQASKKALELDDSSPEAHATAGAINLFYDWDWKIADEESRRALALDANSAVYHHMRSYYLTAMNRLHEALQEDRLASQLAPFQHPSALGLALLNSRQYDAAEKELRLRKEAQPADLYVRSFLSKCYWSKGMQKESVMELTTIYELTGQKDAAAAVREAFQRGGSRAVSEWRLRHAQSEATKHYVSPLEFAEIYARLQNKNETLKYLEAAYQERSPWLIFLQHNPDLDFLHSDERYRTIVRNMGLPPAY